MLSKMIVEVLKTKTNDKKAKKRLEWQRQELVCKARLRNKEASLTASRAFLQQLLACINFTFDSKEVQTKKLISSCTSCWKPQRWMKLDLILVMRDIYINSNLNPHTKLISSSRSTEVKDILPWNISQIITKTVPISTWIVMGYSMKQGILLWVCWKVSGNWDKNMIRISQWRESHCRTIYLHQKKEKNPKEQVCENSLQNWPLHSAIAKGNL